MVASASQMNVRVRFMASHGGIVKIVLAIDVTTSDVLSALIRRRKMSLSSHKQPERGTGHWLDARNTKWPFCIARGTCPFDVPLFFGLS